MKTFGGIESQFAGREESDIYLQSIPYDGTSTWGKGADKGFAAFLEASKNMELYDIETQTEVYKRGIHLLPELSHFDSPEEMFQKVYKLAKDLISEGRFNTFFGGEHSISIGIIKAYYEHFENLSVLQIDAHSDLRQSYNGSQYNHACALYDCSLNCNLVQVGIRSMDITEKINMQENNVFYAKDIIHSESWQIDSINRLTDKVYITLDLDALDPSIMPSTGTPEPGGFSWWQLTKYLRQVFKHKVIVGFDIVELAPIPKLPAPNFLAAKLYYKMLSYKFENNV